MVCIYFLSFCRLLFQFIIIAFAVRSFLVWFSPTCLFLAFVLLVSYPQKSLQRAMSRSFPYMFPSKSFMVSGFTFKSLILHTNFMSGVRWEGSSHSFACEYPVFLALFVEENAALHALTVMCSWCPLLRMDA